MLENLLLLPRMLRSAGLAVSLDQTLGFARALEWVDLSEREQVFSAARALLVTRCETLRLFEAVFHSFWRLCRDGQGPRLPRPDPPPPAGRDPRPFTVATYAAFKARAFDAEGELVDRSATYSSREVLRRKDFAEMTDDELAHVRRLIAGLRWRSSLRRTRRRIAARDGDRLDLRRLLRTLARTGSVPPRPAWRRRKVKPRPIVLIADVSGSMERVSRLVLQLFFSLRQGLPDVECFTFGTRLTRITAQLGIKNVDRALFEATRAVVDFAGGTRIGESLGDFNRRFSRRVLRRGAVAVVISDGWERGRPERLATETGALARRCHRLIWLNPLAGKPGYRPRVEGMAAALPFVDDFLPIGNLENLDQLADRLRSLPAKRGAGKNR